MKTLIHDAFGERRVALCDEQGPVEIQIYRDICLNFNDKISAKITSYSPVLQGYFAATERGDVFLPIAQKLCEGDTLLVQITKEARSDKVATAYPCDEEVKQDETEGIPVSETEMDEYIDEAMCSDIPVSTGGMLHIERNKVCWTIDVDSGKSSIELDKLNQKAVAIIVRQIRLKNMGGLILIDFAGSKRTKLRTLLEKKIKELMKSDTLTRVCGWTKSGLFELERKRTRADLWTSCAENNPVAAYYRVLRALDKYRSGKVKPYVTAPVLALLQKKGMKAEPVFDKPVSYFEIREK